MKRYNCKQFFIFCLITIICIFNNSLNPRVFAEQQQQQKNDLDFAEKLIEASSTGKFDFFDIAEEITLEIKNKPFSKEIQQQAYLLLGKLKKSQAGAERDIEKRSKLNDEAIDILTKFISENPDYSRLVDAKFEVAELLIVNKGISNSNQLKLETDPIKKQSLIQQTELAFKQASEYLSAMISYYQKILAGDITDQSKREEIDNDISKALYFQGIDYYYWGILYGKTEENHKKYLQEAVKIFTNLILSIGEQLRSYEAANYLGICYMELEKYPNAKGYFSMSARLYDSIMKDPDKSEKEKNEIIEEQRDIIQQGCTRLAMLANATKEYKEAIRIIDDLLKKFPDKKSDEWIQRGLLEKATALYYTNAKDKALSMVQEIIDTTKDSSIRSSAKDTLNSFIKSGVGGGGSIDIIISTMRDLFNKNKLGETIKQGQTLMNLLNNSLEEVKIQYLPEVLYIIGESLKSRERYYEAAIIYEAIYLNPKYKNSQSTKKEPVAPLAAYGAASVYLKMNSLTGDESDRLKYKETLSYLVKNWPESDPAKEVQYFQAKEKEEEGKFLEAADSYSKVPPSSKYYFESKFRTGQMYSFHIDKQLYPSYKQEKDATKKISKEEEISRYLALSEETLNNAIKSFGEKLKEPLDEETKNKMLSFDINSRLFLSRIYLNEFNRKYAEVLTLLSGLEKKYPNAIDQILSLKIEAFVRTGDFNSAESLLRDLKNYAAKENTPEILAFPLQSIALTYEKIADSIIAIASTPEEKAQRKIKIAEKKDKFPDEYKKFTDVLQRSCECFSQWVEVRKKTITPDEVLTVANKLYQAAEETEKNDFYTKASKLYERIIDKEFQNKLPTTQEIWVVKWKLAITYRALGDKEKALNILEKLDQEQTNNVDIKRELALAYDDLGSLEKVAYWQSAKKKWAELGRLLKEQSEGWWETRYFLVLIDFKAGNFKEALHSINMIENAINKDFDEDKFGYKTKFLDLKQKIEAKTGVK